MVMEPRYFQVDKDGPIIIWKFNNPPQNLWNNDTGPEFTELVEEFYDSSDFRVGIITSAMPDVFIQHFDVSLLVEWAEYIKKLPPSPPVERGEPRGIYRCGPKPVIAAINAPLAGGGLEMAMACDFRFMSRNAWASQAEINVGILAGGGGTQRMPRLIGINKALELQLTGRQVYADEAERIGLITKACDPAQLMPETLSFARELASKSPLAVALIKQCIYEGTGMPLRDGLALESESFWKTLISDDAMQAMKQYVESGQDVKSYLEKMAQERKD